ncbi:MAG: hypothetical protein SGJ19_06200, partial [Planctomycetia bacterium]|nr:hypothetical protein [Planctomycetia bacterium]
KFETWPSPREAQVQAHPLNLPRPTTMPIRERLRKSGKSLSEIAKATSTQFATVKDWTKDIEKGTK